MLAGIDARTQGIVMRDGVRIHYQVFGTGERAILFLPTWSIVHSDLWRHQVRHFSARYTVVTFDGRGNGASDRPGDASAYSDQHFAEDALAVLDAVGVEQAVLVSVSGGAPSALIATAENAERVAAAVFIAPSLPLSPVHPDRAEAMGVFDVPRETYEGWFKFNRHYWHEDWQGFLEFFAPKCFTEPDSDEEIQHFIQMGLETTPDVIEATADAPGLDEKAAVDLAGSVQCPVLVVQGDADAVSPVDRGAKLSQLTNGELIVLPGAGHQPQCSNPNAFNRLLDDFLDRAVQWR